MRYFFIVGSPRSGTTLLQSVLLTCEGLVIPPETQFFAHVRASPPAYADPGRRALQKRLVDYCHSVEMAFDEDRFAQELKARPAKTGDVFRALMIAVGVEAGVEIVGEKSPLHTSHVLEILGMFPGARVLHIVRDPRDVALSWRESWDRTVLAAALRWRRDMQHHELYSDLLPPATYRLLRYEDLVARTEQTAREVSGFLSIPYDPAMCQPHRRKRTGIAPHWGHLRRTLEPITSSRVGRWMEELGDDETALVERICGPWMGRHGYEPGGPRWHAGIRTLARESAPILREHLKHRTRRSWSRRSRS